MATLLPLVRTAGCTRFRLLISADTFAPAHLRYAPSLVTHTAVILQWR
jgi:hypothetical protein